MRRRLIIFLVLLLLLLGGGAGAIHWVIHSDYPRQMVLEAAQRETGLRIEARSLRTTWGGVTVLEDAAVSLPLEDEPFATVPHITVRHSSILGMLASRSVTVESVTLEQPHLLVREREGVWNLAEAAALLAQRADPDAAPMGPLPRVAVNEARITLQTERGTSELHPVTFTGEPYGSVAWQFTTELPDEQGILTGRFSLSSDTPHELTLAAVLGGEMVGQLVPAAAQPITVDMDWRGRVEEGAIRGRAEIRQLKAGTYDVRGGVRVVVTDGQVVLTPEEVELNGVAELDAFESPLRLRGGTIRVEPEHFRARELVVQLAQHRAQITGDWSRVSESGSFTGSWTSRLAVRQDEEGFGLALGGSTDRASDDAAIEHRGTMDVTLARPAIDRIAVNATFGTYGSSPWAGWESRVVVQAEGASWLAMEGTITLPQTLVMLDPLEPEPQPIEVGRVTMALQLDWPAVTLRSVDAAGPVPMTGRGAYDFHSRQWRLAMDVPRLVLPEVDLPAAALAIRSHGVGDHAQIETLTLRSDRLDLDASGRYAHQETQPLRLDVSVVARLDETDAKETAATEGLDTAGSGRPQWGGRWHWRGELVGSPLEQRLTATGQLASEEVILNHHTLQPMALPVTLTLADRRLTIDSQPFDLLDGRCELTGSYVLGDDEATLTLNARNISLKRAARFANQAFEMEGTWHGENLTVTVPFDQLEDLRVTGEVTIEDFRTGQLAFDRLDGTLSSHGHIMRFDPVTIRLNEGTAEGQASFDLQQGRTVVARLTSDNWPIEVAELGLMARVDGEADLHIDVLERTVTAPELNIRAQVRDELRDLADLAFVGELRPQVLRLSRVEGNVLSGTVMGHATIDLADWHRSAGELTYRDFALADLEAWLPLSDLVDGRASGTFSFAQAEDRRALEPLRIEITITGDEAEARGVEFVEGNMIVYAGRRQRGDRQEVRIIVDPQGSTINVADGTLSLWTSITLRDGQWYSHLRADFEGLDLARLKEAAAPGTAYTPGRLAGHITFVGSIRDWQRATGDARIALTESDLSDTDIIAAVFNALGIFAIQREPTGYGNLRLRLEDGMVRIQSMRYFNRGVEINMHGTIRDIRQGMDSPILIFAGGTLRPLRELQIPGAAMIDEMFATFQSSFTAIRAAGTLGDPRPRPMPLAEVTQTLRDLLQGADVEEPTE